MRKQYKVVNGTSYDIRTKDKVIEVLETCRLNDTRIVLNYGSIETGESWNDEGFSIIGRVSRSTGISKIPILLHNSKSTRGRVILDDCIIGIKTSLGKVSLYNWNE